MNDALTCTACRLHKHRTKVVLGRGDPQASFWLTGEAPGRDEDKSGIAFVGAAGRLLDMCLYKERIVRFYIANTLKCRPPDNRDPQLDEFEKCKKWLRLQLEEHRPRVVVAMGRFSIGFFKELSWGQIRAMGVTRTVKEGLFYYMLCDYELPVFPNFHPAYILRNGDMTPTFLNVLRKAKKLHKSLS